MRWMLVATRCAALAILGIVVPVARSEVLTEEKAVQLALQRSTSIVSANAAVVNARSGVYSAASGVLPSIDAGWSRSGSLTNQPRGSRPFGGVVFTTPAVDAESYSSAPTLSGRWPILDLSGIQGLRSARTSLRAAELRRGASRAQVALDARGAFYGVVRAVQLSVVANQAVRLARDDERRVRALFEVGSVSRSDLLKAQVRTSQAELDSITRMLDIVNQRVVLARQIGVRETDLGDVDTTLVVQAKTFDEAALLAEAERERPDLQAAEADLRAARSGLSAANLARFPFVELTGQATWSQSSTFKNRYFLVDSTGRPFNSVQSGSSLVDRSLNGTVGVTWKVFSGLRTEAQISSARARLLIAQDARDQERRNLEAEVHAALLSYREAVAALDVAERGLASAEENVRLTQQKYNVGSATILELIDAQVQVQQARSNRVSALAGIRLAEAALDRVRGRT